MQHNEKRTKGVSINKNKSDPHKIGDYLKMKWKRKLDPGKQNKEK